MLKNINYSGWELKFFDRAKNYRQYQFDLIKKYILGDVAEIGPGNGLCASYYINLSNKLDLYEPTYKLFKKLKKNFRYQKKINIFNKEFNKNKKKYNTILCLDVLEHIKDDHKQIYNAHFSLKKHGFLIINVPAFQSLYSSKDISLKHYRRYNKETLHFLLNKHFHEIKFTYFNFILFLPIAVLILFFKITKIKFISTVEKKPNFLINKLAFYLFAFESFFINKIKFPFGISLLFFGKKVND
jgi:hypothetical protein